MPSPSTTPPSIINSRLKKLKPVTAYSSCLVDTANNKVFFKLFNKALQSSSEHAPNHIERLAHLIMVSFKLKSATLVNALIPMVEKVSPNQAEEMVKHLSVMEGLYSKISQTRKHRDNKEFVDLMKQMEEQNDKAEKIEFKVLCTMVKEIPESELITAFHSFEKAKLQVSFIPAKAEEV